MPRFVQPITARKLAKDGEGTAGPPESYNATKREEAVIPSASPPLPTRGHQGTLKSTHADVRVRTERAEEEINTDERGAALQQIT